MATGVNRKISAASARSHTRRAKQKSGSVITSGMVKKLLLVSFIGLVAWTYQASRPPPPKICGSPDGPPVTASRVKLNDGRHLAYKEHGVSKDKAKYKIVYVHGFDNSRHDVFIAGASPDIIEGLGIYIVSFDRPGYGESDPDPNRTEKSLAFDIEELADKLELGSKFYIAGFSMGAQVVWSCLKYIPHRVAGATLLAPLVNFWWPGFPANLSTEVFNQQFPRDQWTYRVAHYLPSLTYWWNTQTWFPSSSVIARNPALLSSQDIEIIQKMPANPYQGHSTQQGVYESIHRDLLMAFGTWEFDPMDLENPFPNNEGSIHIWHGDEDGFVPIELQRYIAQKLPWITYHEIPGAGHFFPAVPGMSDAIVKSLLTGEK